MTFCSLLLSNHTWGAAQRPNVVWIIADDLGPELGCYGYPDVATPNLDQLAAKGVRYSRAFSTAPVCSSSRTAFQTGRFQTTVGGHHHNTRDKSVLPYSIPTVTGLMRKAGYFVVNGHGIDAKPKKAKSHLNFIYKDETFFDGHDWSERDPGQPFFAQLQIKEPHRSFLRSVRSYPNAPIPSCYPEHPITRADWNNYLASIEEMDRKVGLILERLKNEGELERTLVIFFGDHGRPHVRGKQWLYDGGIHTPLILSWPKLRERGVTKNDLASLLDLMPTTLAAAGVDAPGLPGLNLLAEDWQGHNMVFAARDRCGDAVDRIRSVRTSQYKYIRNFHPDRPYLQLSSYKKLQYPVETLMKVLHKQGKWDSLFMSTSRPAEELYDVIDDPDEMNNLADDPRHQVKLAELRNSVNQWITETGDLGSVDESKTIDMDGLMKEKRRYYERSMQKRGLNPDLSDEEYLSWWEEQLGVKRPSNAN